jgi:hypothetical protein
MTRSVVHADGLRNSKQPGNQMPADWEYEAGYLGKWRARSPSNLRTITLFYGHLLNSIFASTQEITQSHIRFDFVSIKERRSAR